MKIAKAIENTIIKLENILQIVTVFMLMAMMFLGAADVIGRYIFNSPITGAMEISQLLMGIAIILGWGYVQSTKSNIRVEFIIMRYPPKLRSVIELLILILTVALFVFIAWQSIEIAILDLSYGRLIENVYIPAFPFKLLVTFGACMVCIESLIQIVRLLHDMAKKER